MNTANYATPQDAETAFYRAFEEADLSAMMAVWSCRDDIVCIHPMGERLVGHKDIAASWQQIFSGDGSLRFSLASPQYVTGTDMSVHFVYEDISFGDGFAERSRVLATNTYVLEPDGWRILSHHGSPGVAVRRPPPPPSATVH